MNNLKEATSTGSVQCYCCRFAGSDLKMWPQEPGVAPEEIQRHDQFMQPIKDDGQSQYTMGKWHVYVNADAYKGTEKVRSGRKSIDACWQHWAWLGWWWQQIAFEEVALDYIFNQWLDRSER